MTPDLLARLTDAVPLPHVTTLVDPRVIVGPDRLYRCCSWCCTPAQLAAINQAHPKNVSHALCQSCREIMEQEIA